MPCIPDRSMEVVDLPRTPRWLHDLVHEGRHAVLKVAHHGCMACARGWPALLVRLVQLQLPHRGHATTRRQR
jgi:hypothetical protein